MRVEILPGKYIVAVSGGVDSAVLLDILSKKKNLDLVVAHFNHNIRPTSKVDEEFVVAKAKALGLSVEIGEGHLGPSASEDRARKARYEFLTDLADKYEADSIITGHHQDDLIETALINIMRGTGPRGLVPMIFNPDILRPLLNTPKKDILAYAKKNNIDWVEDDSNQDPRYLRNLLRIRVMAEMTQAEREEMLKYIDEVRQNYEEADGIMETLGANLFEDDLTLRRSAFILLPNEISSEVIARWLRKNKISADRPSINRLVVAVKTARAGTSHNIDKHYKLKLNSTQAHLVSNTLSSA
jgi:tRNA(Ile)-lysidine synthetase-like protein